jgi:hypothetical protein
LSSYPAPTHPPPPPSQEEAKVAALSEKLSGMGVDVEALLDAVTAAGET